jgi:hypothetical protein
MRKIDVLTKFECLGIHPQEPVPLFCRWRQQIFFHGLGSQHPALGRRIRSRLIAGRLSEGAIS